jgi:hypothetical protein
VDQTGHGGRRDDEGQRDWQAENVALGGDVCDVAHDAWTEPDAAVKRLVCVAGDEAGVGRGIKGPCFGAGGISGGELKVLGIDEGFEGWFFGSAVWCGFGGLVFQGFSPCFCDGGGVEDALQGAGGEAFFDDGGGVDGRVRFSGVAAGVLVYYCNLLSARSGGRWVEAGGSRLTPWSTWMVWCKACDVPYLPIDYYPAVGVGVVL